jgi:hypothetical protein
LYGHNSNIKYKGICTDAANKIINYDYLALLSDSEGYPYAVVEALARQKPVLITPFEEALNMVMDGVDGYIVPFDVSQFDYSKLLSPPIPRTFKPKATEQTWIDFFNNYLNNLLTMRRIRITGENATFKVGEVVEVENDRADRATRIGIAEYVGPDVPLTCDKESYPVEDAAPESAEENVESAINNANVKDEAVSNDEKVKEPVKSEVKDKSVKAEKAPKK